MLRGRDTKRSVTTLYDSYLKPIAQRLGLHHAAFALYRRYKFGRHSGVSTHEIAGTTARFSVTTPAEFDRFYDISSEAPIIADLLGAVDEDDVVYDIGANTGLYTCFVAQRVPPERVLAFEPHPANVAALRTNLALNETDATVYERALADGTGDVELAVDEAEAGAGQHSLQTDVGAETITVPSTTGDDLVETGEAPQPTVLKIDVEGAEARVLAGFERTLDHPACRQCYVELHPDRLPAFGDSVTAVREQLRQSGFDLQPVADRGSEQFLKATK